MVRLAMQPDTVGLGQGHYAPNRTDDALHMWNALRAVVYALPNIDYLQFFIAGGAMSGIADPGQNDASHYCLIDAGTPGSAQRVGKIYKTLTQSCPYTRKSSMLEFGHMGLLAQNPSVDDVDTLSQAAGLYPTHSVEWIPPLSDDRFCLSIGSLGEVSAADLTQECQAHIRMALVDFAQAVITSKRTERNRKADLTSKQIETLRMVARAMTDQEIAEILGISFSAVRRRFEAIQTKLGVSKRTDMMVRAVHDGYIAHSMLDDATQA